jgi:hypothetical protein
MIAVGVGGADAVDALAGMPWEVKCPKVRVKCLYINNLLLTLFVVDWSQVDWQIEQLDFTQRRYFESRKYFEGLWRHRIYLGILWVRCRVYFVHWHG